MISFMISFIFYFIPLPFSGDCSPVSGPKTLLMFATPVRGLELSEIWGLFIQIREILSQQWNCVFSPLDVAAFLFPSCFRMSNIIFYMSKFFLISRSKNLDPLLGVEPGSSRFVVLI